MYKVKTKQMPSQQELARLFDYNALTGELRWRVSRAQRCAGDIAGSLKKDGYWVVGLNNTTFKAHRIIWKLVSGKEPEDQIDHIDTDPSNNRWANLREASACQNMQNRTRHSNSSSGVKGVSYNKSERKWDAYIMADRKFRLIGRFKDKDIAARVVAEERQRLHGDFARFT